jgi:acyl-CoA reductase-like NAD-dependent aldehyde dehydrogenase
MFEIARVLREHAEELAQLESLSIGKPISDARDEIAMGARTFEYYAGAISKFYGQTIPVGGADSTSPCASRWAWWRPLCRGTSLFPLRPGKWRRRWRREIAWC